MTRMHKRFLDTAGMSMQEAQNFGEELALLQRDIMFWIGDLQRYAEYQWPEHYHQIWPEWVSNGMLARAAGVCKQYPSESDRQHECTYSQYMQAAGKPDRQKRLAYIVDHGQTTDESRQDAKRWCCAIDVNYYLHRFWHSGAGVEAANSVASWIQRTVDRLKGMGLTDVACCFDDAINHRKALTADWEDQYKDRPPKDIELTHQLALVRSLLSGHGFCCVSHPEMEADDCMASIAKQFPGRVTLLTQDKDCRQCLSPKCNILLDVEWIEDEQTGHASPEFKWLTLSSHFEETGIPADKWVQYQAIAGDAVDGIKGAVGIGKVGAVQLVKEYGTAAEAINAAQQGDEIMKPKQRQALLDFASRLDVTLRLVTLVDDLPIPNNTGV